MHHVKSPTHFKTSFRLTLGLLVRYMYIVKVVIYISFVKIKHKTCELRIRWQKYIHKLYTIFFENTKVHKGVHKYKKRKRFILVEGWSI